MFKKSIEIPLLSAYHRQHSHLRQSKVSQNIRHFFINKMKISWYFESIIFHLSYKKQDRREEWNLSKLNTRYCMSPLIYRYMMRSQPTTRHRGSIRRSVCERSCYFSFVFPFPFDNNVHLTHIFYSHYVAAAADSQFTEFSQFHVDHSL